jgi:hypothetical protein
MEDIDYNGNTGVRLGADAQAEWDRLHAEASGSTDERYATTAHESTPTGQDAEADEEDE